MSSRPRQYTLVNLLDTEDDSNTDKRMNTSLIGSQPISVIIPTLNEGANIANLLIRLYQTLAQAQIDYEAIVVDDHSTDDTVAVAESVAKDRNLPVRIVIKHGQPGKSSSLIEGFAAAQFDVLAMIDGDLQYPPEALLKMVTHLRHADIVVADRRTSYSGANRLRSVLSQIFIFIFGMLFGIDTDIQSGLKVFYRKVYEGIPPNLGKWSLDLHLVTQAIGKGYVLANVPITIQERQGGISKVNTLSVALELLMAALQLKMTQALQSIGWFNNRQRSNHFPQSNAVPNIPTVDANVVEQVKYFTEWLDAEAARKRNSTAKDQEGSSEYINYALRMVKVRGQEVSTFAPFRDKLSALQTMTFTQIAMLIAVLVALVLGLVLYGKQMLVAAITVITIFYLSDLLLTFLLSMRTFSNSAEEQISDEIVHMLTNVDWPRYTILCPLYREANVVPQFVRGIQAMDYPSDKLQVLFLTEEIDVETRNAIRAMELLPHFQIVTVPAGEPRTKPRACNFGLLLAIGDYIVIYDAEDIPDPLQLKKAVLTFAKQGLDVACVQAKLNFYNPQQNLLTRWFTAEYSLWFDLTLPGLQRTGLSLPLGGTSNHFRAEALRTLGAWDAFNVTEDCDLGLRLARYGLKTAMLDSTTYEEANSRVKNWLRQRSRWIKGYMQTYLVYMRHPLRYLKPGHLRDFLALQLIIGGKAAVLFVNPLMWMLLAIYVLFRPIVGNAYQTLFPAPVFYMGTICLIFGNFFYIYSHLVGCMKRRQYGLIKWTLLIPIYWMMTSVAAFIALYQLIFKPHYWEKTQHGLHTATSTSSSRISWVADALEPVEIR